jgi:hypothetical protein
MPNKEGVARNVPAQSNRDLSGFSIRAVTMTFAIDRARKTNARVANAENWKSCCKRSRESLRDC